MTHLYRYILLCFMLLCITSCYQTSPKDLSKESIIPIPVSLEATGQSFVLDSETRIVSNNSDLGNYLSQMIKSITGNKLTITESKSFWTSRHIILQSDGSDPEDESYTMDIHPKMININAKSEHGLFNGIQTLLQLIPIESENNKFLVATGKIEDAPRFGYRGMMMDVSRHFFPPNEIKRLIDLLAMYKINMLHLHLSDDQGWRIEIKSWPKLTTIGGSTEVGGKKGGFYTQEEFKELVAYAASRQITIVPEIDMPGHTNAALVSYPELNCNPKDPNPKPYTGMRVGFSTFCTEKEIVYTFIDDVVREISDISPGPYFHIGGDESHVTPKADYINFINRVQQIIKKYGKKTVGWDEIAQSKLQKGSVVHLWWHVDLAQKGISQGNNLLISLANKAYLDMKYDSTTTIGLDWAGHIEVDSAYAWDPSNISPSIRDQHIIGVEAPLWSETVKTMDDIEYLAFPRIIGYAEIAWSPQEKREWNNYATRLAKQKPRLDALNVDFYHSPKIDWK